MKATEYSDGTNEGSKATVFCRQHYRMNLPYEKDPFIYGKKSSFAYCVCKARILKFHVRDVFELLKS